MNRDKITDVKIIITYENGHTQEIYDNPLKSLFGQFWLKGYHFCRNETIEFFKESKTDKEFTAKFLEHHEISR